MLARPTAEAPEADPCRRLAAPFVWVLEDDKLGHTMQSLALATALGWQFTRKALHFNVLNRVSNLLLGAGLLSLDQNRSTPLLPPWPDLVIATGRRTAPVARWIRRQSRGRTRLVQLGRKGADRADDFDLSVSCAHFAKPPHPHRIETLLPLTTIDDRRLEGARERWPSLFGSAPRPHVAMIVGGTSALHRLSASTAARMGREAMECVRAAGGSLFVVTSPRTGTSASAALCASLGTAGRFYQWRPGDPDNPYLGCLAMADALIVTGDSESMLADALSTGTTVQIYPLPERRKGTRYYLRARVSQWAANLRRSWLRVPCARLIDLGLVRTSRDINALHRRLIDAGHAHPFGASLDRVPRRPLREREQVAERVHALFDDSFR